MKNRALWICLWAVLILSLGQTLVNGDVNKLNISQVTQDGNDLYLYVNVLQSDGRASDETLGLDGFKVAANSGKSLQTEDVYHENELGEGVAYTFAMDISGSVTEEEMNSIHDAVAAFVDRISDADYVRLVTIGSEVTPVCEWTQNKDEIVSAVSEIRSSDKFTYLYRGLDYALDEYRKNYDSLPKRSAIILFSDGMDDSDGSFSESDIIQELEDIKVPIYVVGLKGKDPAANLTSVSQIARQSGGSVFSYNNMSIPDSVSAVENIVQNAYRVHVRPSQELFEKEDCSWKVSYSADGYSIKSSSYNYTLNMDEAVFDEPSNDGASAASMQESATDSVKEETNVQEETESEEAPSYTVTLSVPDMTGTDSETAPVVSEPQLPDESASIETTISEAAESEPLPAESQAELTVSEDGPQSVTEDVSGVQTVGQEAASVLQSIFAGIKKSDESEAPSDHNNDGSEASPDNNNDGEASVNDAVGADTAVTPADDTEDTLMEETDADVSVPEVGLSSADSAAEENVLSQASSTAASAAVPLEAGDDNAGGSTDGGDQEIIETDTAENAGIVDKMRLLFDKAVAFFKSNPYILIAAALILAALIILIAALIKRSRRKKEMEWGVYNASSNMFSEGGSTIIPYQPMLHEGDTVAELNYGSGQEDKTSAELWGPDDDGKTVAELWGPEQDDATIAELYPAYGADDDDATIDDLSAKGILIKFDITFDGKTESVERRVGDCVILGRGKDCDIDVTLGSDSELRRYTSHKHAGLYFRKEEGLILKDEESRNKVFVNGVEMEGETAVKDGDVIRLGKSEVKLEILEI